MRSETALIELIERLADGGAGEGVVVGIGDDCAVLKPPANGSETLATSDQVIEGRHFRMEQHPPKALGRKLLARGLSDIAAMGGLPDWLLLSLALPERLNGPWVEEFLTGLLGARGEFGAPRLPLAGGDVSGADTFAAQITVCGSVPKGQALLRSGVHAGDQVYVSGALGGSALGLERLASCGEDDAAVARHLKPTPRLGLGAHLKVLGASAAVDISDGLSTEAAHLANASGVALSIELEAVPRFAGASEDQALHGGEEYELLFTAPAAAEIPNDWEGLPLTRVGLASDGEGVSLVTRDGERKLEPGGFEHLAADR